MEDESVRGIIRATALGFVALVVIWMGVAVLVLGFEPLFALAYAFSYGSFAAVVLTRSGWSPGDAVGAGSPLHHANQQATTMTFFGMIAGQIGTAFAVRTQRASLRSVGVFSNRFLLLGIAGELVLAAFFIYAPPMQALLCTTALPPSYLLITLPYPFIVWGADELRRYVVRRRAAQKAVSAGADA